MYRLSIPALVIAAILGCNSDQNFQKDINNGDIAEPPGLPASTQEDLIVQTVVPNVDVLYVIDNSCSMGDKQQRLAQNFPRFMQYFLNSGLDYHIGVTTTDMDGNGPGFKGSLRLLAGQRWVDTDSTSPVELFTSMALVGENGSATEYGRAPAYTALEIKRNGDNAGFVRDEAVQHIIFLSDEPDQSTNTPISKQEFLNWMRGFKLIPEQTIAHAIVGPPGAGFGACASPGGHYLDYANATNGVKFNICAPAAEWPAFLEELGFQASGLKREFFLSQLPVPSTITVTVAQMDGETQQTVSYSFHQDPAGDPRFRFNYDGQRNSIAFEDFLPDPFAQVTINYQLLASTITIEDTN